MIGIDSTRTLGSDAKIGIVSKTYICIVQGIDGACSGHADIEHLQSTKLTVRTGDSQCATAARSRSNTGAVGPSGIALSFIELKSAAGNSQSGGVSRRRANGGTDWRSQSVGVAGTDVKNHIAIIHHHADIRGTVIEVNSVRVAQIELCKTDAAWQSVGRPVARTAK